MSDLISRQAAIDAVKTYWKKVVDDIPKGVGFEELTQLYDMVLEHNANILKAIDQLPSAQPERKTGQLKYESAYNWFRCNVCRKIYPSEFMQYFDSCQYQPGFNFCPNCGADMRGEQDG